MDKSIDPTIIISIRLQIRREVFDAFLRWQEKFNTTIAPHEGFISLEYLAVADAVNEWVIVQRFQSRECLLKWRHSEEYNAFLAELKSFQKNPKIEIEELESHSGDTQSGVTEFFVVEVKPEKERAFIDWMGKIHKEQAKFPGFRSTYVQSPKDGKGKNWVTFIQFDTREHLENWLNSKERLSYLEDSKELIISIESHRVISSFAGWFSGASAGGEAPPVWKQTMIVLLILFPIVMLEQHYLSPLLKGLNSSIATFIANVITVTLIAWPSMPIAIKCLRWWLIPLNMTTQKSLLGTMLLIGLYLIQIAFFLSFFLIFKHWIFHD